MVVRVVVGIELDPSIGPGKDAAIGEAVVPAVGLLQILETQLGLVGPQPTRAERVAWLFGRLRGADGYWSASFETDPWGTASRLIRDRDALATEGWRGEPVSPRWNALWALTAGIPPGHADRWAAVEAALPSRTIALAELRLVDPDVEWPGAIRRVFAALRVADVTVGEAVPAAADAIGDLARARSGDFRPEADGSLQLVRAQAGLQAAEDMAAYLAALRDEDPDASVLVVAPEVSLDAALHRAGLPTTGAPAATARARDPSLQLLPLALELIWDPPDPQAVLELLSLPRLPIPRKLAATLAAALRQWPAIGSEDWVDALHKHDFEQDADATVARRRRERTDALLTPAVTRDAAAIPTALLRARIEVIAAWARAVAQSETAPDAGQWWRAGVQHQALLRLLDGVGSETVPEPLLGRLVDAATEAAVAAAPYPAQAGQVSVASPGAVIRPYDTIVWWNFTRNAAPLVHDLGLTRAERAALTDAGIELPSAGDRAMWVARRWRRPLLMARRQLLLVSPRTAAPGEPLHPHPLWDEVTASIPRETRTAMTAALEVSRPGLGRRAQAERTVATTLRLPSYRERWDVPAGALAPRDRESPSGLGLLLGCSLRWALHYALRVTDRRSSYRLVVGPREFGSLAHDVLARVLEDPEVLELPEAHDVEARASAQFDAIGPRRVAHLFLPGRDGEREDVRMTIMRSASAIVQWLQTHDLRPSKIEESLEAPFLGRTVAGQVDLLVEHRGGGRSVVVDFKWGRRDDRRREIQRGTAYQLATYAYAAAQGGPLPEYAYFILRSQLMVGRAGGPFDPDTTVDGPPPADTWEIFAHACRDRLAEVADGVLVAPGGRDDIPNEPTRVNDRLVLPPPCDFCRHNVLCGLAFHAPEEEGA